MWMFCLSACLCTTYIQCAHRGQKRATKPTKKPLCLFCFGCLWAWDTAVKIPSYSPLLTGWVFSEEGFSFFYF